MKNKKLTLIIGILLIISLLVSVKQITAEDDENNYVDEFWDRESGVGEFGNGLGTLSDFAGGFSGFGMLWSSDGDSEWKSSWPAWLQDLFNQGTQEAIGGALCYDLPSGTTGGDNNIATGADPGSAAAWILAEQVNYWVTPEDLRYIYKIQFYVNAGDKSGAYEDDRVCDEMNFKIIKKINGVSSPLIENSENPGVAYNFVLKEGQPAITHLTSLEMDMVLAVSSSDLLGQQICIEFTKMDSSGCLNGHSADSDHNLVCSTIVAGEEYNYNYECDGIGCDLFLNFQDDWEFTPPSDPGGAPTAPTTTTDPATGLPTNMPIITLD